MYRNHLEIFCEAREISQECTILAEDLDSAPAPTLGSSQLLVTLVTGTQCLLLASTSTYMYMVHTTFVDTHTELVGHEKSWGKGHFN